MQAITSGCKEPGRRVHQEDPHSAGAREGGACIRLSDPRLVEATDRDVRERRGDTRGAVDEDLDAGALERAHDAAVVRPEIVVAEYRHLAAWRVDAAEKRDEAIDVFRIQEDEVAAEEEDVGFGVRYRHGDTLVE